VKLIVAGLSIGISALNILVDSSGRVRILDFGLGGDQGEKKLTKTGSTMGTLYYMFSGADPGITLDDGPIFFLLAWFFMR